MTNKKTLIKVLYWIYLIVLVAFIFRNSFLSQQASAGESKTLQEYLNNIESINASPTSIHNMIRKGAHIIEYSILGISIFGLLIINKTISMRNSFYCAFAALMVAMVDETIQYFTGRGSMLIDVWLDFASAILGISLLYLIVHLCKRRKPAKKHIGIRLAE